MIKQLVDQNSFYPWFTKLFQTGPVVIKTKKSQRFLCSREYDAHVHILNLGHSFLI
jgi:hypothetical protein